ncbi:MAG: response regulator [Deltaproteobacteria bacterium]|nr:response regulator [Deltaproteobacteria bacterium]
MPRETSEHPETSEGLVEGPGLDGGRGTILVAEDDEGMRDSITAILQHFGYEVIEAVNGRDAVCTFEFHKERVDLVLLDVIMPEMNGMQARDRILTIRPGAKILFMSGYSGDLLHAHGLFDSGHQLLEKPIRPHLLLNTIRDILAEKA